MIQALRHALARDALRDDEPTAPLPHLGIPASDAQRTPARAMLLPVAFTAFHLPLVADVMTSDLVAQIAAERAAQERQEREIPDESESEIDVSEQETMPLPVQQTQPQPQPQRVSSRETESA